MPKIYLRFLKSMLLKICTRNFKKLALEVIDMFLINQIEKPECHCSYKSGKRGEEDLKEGKRIFWGEEDFLRGRGFCPCATPKHFMSMKYLFAYSIFAVKNSKLISILKSFLLLFIVFSERPFGFKNNLDILHFVSAKRWSQYKEIMVI